MASTTVFLNAETVTQAYETFKALRDKLQAECGHAIVVQKDGAEIGGWEPSRICTACGLTERGWVFKTLKPDYGMFGSYTARGEGCTLEYRLPKVDEKQYLSYLVPRRKQ